MKKLNKKGFSLVELIIVIAIMAVLIGVLAPTYLGQVNKSKKSADLQNAQELATAIAVKAAQADASTGLTAANWTKITTTIAGVAELPDFQAVKKSDGYFWMYKYDGTSVHIGIGKTEGSSSDAIELYPVATSSYGN